MNHENAGSVPVACVLGGMDIVAPLAMAGISSVVWVGRDDPARYSRHVREALDALHPWRDPEAYVACLVDWAVKQPARPVLFYPTDGDLLMASRFRDRLRPAFHMAIPPAELVEDLVDKERFQALAARVGLRMPRSYHLSGGAGSVPEIPLDLPVVIKPVNRRKSARIMHRNAKAIRADNAAELADLCRTVIGSGVDCMVQEMVPGPETAIESYHVYVDSTGRTVSEFTGAKLRTEPPEFGESTSVTITDRADVLVEGRRVISAIGLTGGVAKVDFKRALDGTLWLLEVNPRFNLWHHPGAVAGANLPALVYADLVGRDRPQSRPVRPGVTWCEVREDLKAVVRAGRSQWSWARSVARADTRSTGAWSDPMPLVRGIVLPALRHRLPGSRLSGRG